MQLDLERVQRSTVRPRVDQLERQLTRALTLIGRAAHLLRSPQDANEAYNEAEEISPEWAAAGTDVLFHAVVETAEIVG